MFERRKSSIDPVSSTAWCWADSRVEGSRSLVLGVRLKAGRPLDERLKRSLKIF
jgi:hypothetical protein